MSQASRDYEQHMQLEMEQEMREMEDNRRWDILVEMAQSKGLVVVPAHMVKVQ